MPIEKRPIQPVPKGAPPGSRTQPYKVTNIDTWETVASKYGIPPTQLIVHNFGTTDYAEINWYLHNYVGCRLATQDQKNWRFSSDASPGLLYIPQRVIHGDPTVIIGNPPPVDLNAPGPPLLASEKFVYEFKIPPTDPADCGYFLAQAKISVEGELKQEGGLVKTQIKRNELKVALEGKLTERAKAAFGAKFSESSLKPVAEAIAKGSKGDFIKGLAAPFELAFKMSFNPLGGFVIEPEFDFELSKTPVSFKVLGGFQGPMLVGGTPYSAKCGVKIGCSVGLSAKGWAWVISKVGKQAVLDFLEACGARLEALADWLIASGVLEGVVTVGGAVIGAFALTALCAKMMTDAMRKGEIQGLSTWYRSAYVAKVFGETLTVPRFITGDTVTPPDDIFKVRAKLIQAGEQDAVTDARAMLAAANHPAANGTDQEALYAYRQALLAQNNGSEATAKWKLGQELDARIKQIMNL